MEFILPQELRDHLFVATGSKKENKEQADNNEPVVRKPKYPFGQVKGLIPAEYAPTEEFDHAVTNINNSTKHNRHHTFRDAHNNITAILYYYQYVWVAAWIGRDEDEFLYGVTLCHRNSQATIDKCQLNLEHISQSHERFQHGIFNYPLEYQCKTVKFKRSEYVVATRYVTKQDVMDFKFKLDPKLIPSFDRGEYQYLSDTWIPVFASHGVSWRYETPSYISHLFLGYSYPVNSSGWTNYRGSYTSIINRFEERLARNFNRIEDSPMLQRMCSLNPLPYMFKQILNGKISEAQFEILHSSTQDINFSVVKSLLTNSSTPKYYIDSDVLAIIETPFFMKEINKVCAEVNQYWQDTVTRKARDFEKKGEFVANLISAVRNIIRIWPDCPIDYLQTHYQHLPVVAPYLGGYVLDETNSPYNWLRDNMPVETNSPYNWLRDNMPVKSFFNMLNKAVQQSLESDITIDSYHSHLSEFARKFKDTMNMIKTCLNAEMELNVPDRWRIDEFHDHCMAQSWKVNNPNSSLPQFLLPGPISIQEGDDKWIFFQPKDTHQLAEWGRTVRNCVGNSHYANDVKNNKSFIVLAMLNRKPTFTVQLSKTDGSYNGLNVDQIKSISNASLKTHEEQAYSKVFSQCLAIRAEQIKQDQAKDLQELALSVEAA